MPSIVVGKNPALRSQFGERSGFSAILRIFARIGTRSLHAEDAAFGVDSQRAGTVSVLEIAGKLAVDVEFADPARLFLREEKAAVFRADDAVRVVSSLPNKFPDGSGRDDAGDFRNGDFSQLSGGAAAALCEGEYRSDETERCAGNLRFHEDIICIFQLTLSAL